MAVRPGRWLCSIWLCSTQSEYLHPKKGGAEGVVRGNGCESVDRCMVLDAEDTLFLIESLRGFKVVIC